MDIFDLAFGGIGAKSDCRSSVPLWEALFCRSGIARICPVMKFRGDILACSQFKIVDFLSQKVIQKPPSHIYGGCHEGIFGIYSFQSS